MEEKVVLNVKYPIVNCYPATSNALAILQNYEEVEGWIFNNFIQMFSTDLYTIDYFDFDVYNCPFINYGEMSYEFIKNRDRLYTMIIEMLDAGYYVSVYVDSAMLKIYNMQYGLHQLFIYGVDKCKGIFFCADHFHNGIYSFQQCFIKEVINAAWRIEGKEKIAKERGIRFTEDYYCIQYYKYDGLRHKIKVDLKITELNNKISFSRIRQSCEEYLSGIPTTGWYTRMNDIKGKEKHKFGINVFDVLNKHLEILEEEGEHVFGRQSFFTIYNQKVVMKKRLEFLNIKYGIEIPKEIVEDLNRVILCESNLYKQFLKASMSKRNKKNIIERTDSCLKKAFEYEKKIWPQLVDFFSREEENK